MERTTAYGDSWHRQPPPVSLGGGATSAQWPVFAAVWLLAAWTGGSGAPGWRSECVIGTARERGTQPWPEPPPPAEIAAAGRFDAEPSAATVLISLVQPAERRPYEPTRPPGEVTAELVALLGEHVRVSDARGTALLAYLAEHLTGPYTDLLRVWTGGDELHLLQRDSSGRALRLSVGPAPVTEPPVIAADGADAALRTRLACLLTLLSAELWVNNNNPVTFRVWAGPRGSADPLEAAAGWWTRTREEEPAEPPQLRPLTADELDQGMYTVVRGSLAELFDGSWSGIEEWPHVPPGHLTRYLYRDLLDLLLTRTAGADHLPQLFVTGYLPVTMPEDQAEDDDFTGTVVFVGPSDVAVLDVDLSC
ncbi:hypothetical protein Daura_24060 [Dactylosporangium aurantiacum]|uniref:Uncharacterized protein n=1 Tax=Dactylosporangium aurantiacum TaxID=35754 RepID=A0A9Q9IMM8_9ACTN|nr:hypothetical protein [Dactylosporangium aurantiacum]MDG6103833.1 hypothetical protein [Dactylosporangium aurantiacum]UWZ58967.1 hypothetical protein Daura_24060 [Dactylosporangium aurantiacum]